MYKTNDILLRRKHKVIIPANITLHFSTPREKAMIVSIMKNIESLGFTFDKTVFKNLTTYDANGIERFYFSLLPKLKALTGADKAYKPMYPNFPKQIAEMPDIELIANAIVHYMTSGTILPEYKKDERMPLLDDTSLTVISAGSIDDVMEIFVNLVNSKTNISQQDKDDIAAIISEQANYFLYLPEEIPLKENVAFISKCILEKASIKSADIIQKYYKTATDVLRLVTALSDGDISLAETTKFRSLRRCERRVIMDLLAGCGDILEDMYRYRERWIRIGEIIHPGEYKSSKYDKVNESFDILRNEKKPLFDSGKIQEAIKNKDTSVAINLLLRRPGEFARQLDKLLRDAEDQDYVISAFDSVIDNVSVPVLLQVYNHFINRSANSPIRAFMPKGSTAKIFIEPNKLPKLNYDVCRNVRTKCLEAIIKRLSVKPDIGKVYIDDGLAKFVVPFSQRSASKNSKNLIRGSRIDLNEKANTIRGFIWWTNADRERVDIDLSATIFDKECKYVDHISYTQLRSAIAKSYHSGDITNGGEENGTGVAEFIDFDIDAISKIGRYVVFQIYSFTGQKFAKLPNCRFGWMEREYVNSGENFEPSTVDMCISIQSNSRAAIPVIFDCATRQFIWCDMNMTTRYHFANNAENNLSNIGNLCYAMTHIVKPNIKALILLNVLARNGSIVSHKEDADIIFSNDTSPVIYHSQNHIRKLEDEQQKNEEREGTPIPIVTAYDIDYIVNELL